MLMRILTGELAGQKFELKQGDNIVGRAPDCDIVLNAHGISKKHANVNLDGNIITITDLRSSNGTYLNGIRILKKEVQSSSDKIAFNNIMVDFRSQQQRRAPKQPMFSPPPGYVQGNMALDSSTQQMSQQMPSQQPPQIVAEPTNVFERLQKYIDEVAMPGIYKLAEMFELKMVIGGMILAFVLLMTILSVLPMIRITKMSVESESRRRALTIARNLAASNQSYLQQGVETAVTTKAAEREEGVLIALVISNRDGHVIAPTQNLGEYPDQPFVHKARKENKEMVEQLDDSLIGAGVPVSVYTPEAGPQVIATAVVLYNMGSLAIDSERWISLFSQILLISVVLGFLLYFFICKLFEEPLIQMNSQLDEALKDDTKNLISKFQIPVMKTLITNINSLLQRTAQGSQNQNLQSIDYAAEAGNIVRAFANPSCAIDKDRLFMTVNTAFEELVGMRLLTLQAQSLEILQDQALKMSIIDLLEQCSQNPSLIVSNKLDFSGVPYDVDLQAIQGPSGVAYYLLALRRLETGS